MYVHSHLTQFHLMKFTMLTIFDCFLAFLENEKFIIYYLCWFPSSDNTPFNSFTIFTVLHRREGRYKCTLKYCGGRLERNVNIGSQFFSFLLPRTWIVFGWYNSNVFQRKFKYISKDNPFTFHKQFKRSSWTAFGLYHLDCIWIMNFQKIVSSSNAFQKHISKPIHEVLLDYIVWIALEILLLRMLSLGFKDDPNTFQIGLSLKHWSHCIAYFTFQMQSNIPQCKDLDNMAEFENIRKIRDWDSSNLKVASFTALK